MTDGDDVTVQMEREVVDGKRLSTLWVGIDLFDLRSDLSCALIDHRSNMFPLCLRTVFLFPFLYRRALLEKSTTDPF